MHKLNVLVVGGGGREHALAWKLAQSPQLNHLYVAPGNAGTANIAENVPIKATDIPALISFAKEHEIDLTVVGPDDPLAMGIVDQFAKAGLRAFGPTAAAAKIEASKAFSKDLMNKQGVPTADYAIFTDYQKALASLTEQPVVIKASGLALGKGVVICQTKSEAQQALKAAMLDKVFGEAGNEVVIEEYLGNGQEISFHCLTDGTDFVLFPTAQDHKPIFDGDHGPNTGGMGTFAPVPWAGEYLDWASESVITPILQGMNEAGTPFTGCLYPGAKLTESGPKILEFNARFGDPETQSYMRLLDSDLLELFIACLDGTLKEHKPVWKPGFAVCVILASKGYPTSKVPDAEISGIEEAEEIPNVVVFHSGTRRADDVTYACGGRVLGVTATGDTLQEAVDTAYEAVGKINFEGMQYRKDIAAKALGDTWDKGE